MDGVGRNGKTHPLLQSLDLFSQPSRSQQSTSVTPIPSWVSPPEGLILVEFSTAGPSRVWGRQGVGLG